jgi:ubiquinone/menaquinone biosynthesis C-methylase UbiE
MRERTLANTCPILPDFLKASSRVLDVGCSSGAITLDAARKYPGAQIVGVDSSEKEIREAMEEAQRVAAENTQFSVCDAYSLDFEDDGFDLVYSNAVFEWIRDPVAPLREQQRITRSGGWVIVMVSSWDYVAIYPECQQLRSMMRAMSAWEDAPGARCTSTKTRHTN